MTWERFVKNAPKNSIALDGFVYGAPKKDLDSHHENFNHHEEVDRLATRSTCEQVEMALQQKMIRFYENDGKLELNVFVNDADEDVRFAVWLLSNHQKINDWKVHRLVHASGMLDATAGAYPFDPEQQIIQEIAWIFDPYRQARTSGQLKSMSPEQMTTLITDIGKRISQHITNTGEKLSLDLTHKIVGGGKDWVLAKETSKSIKAAIFHAGHDAYISYRENQNGTYTYTLGKLSDYILFPIEDLYAVLNEAEDITKDNLDRWGGSSLIGGSPRAAGSKLTPKQVEQIVNDYLEKLERKKVAK